MLESVLNLCEMHDLSFLFISVLGGKCAKNMTMHLMMLLFDGNCNVGTRWWFLSSINAFDISSEHLNIQKFSRRNIRIFNNPQ